MSEINKLAKAIVSILKEKDSKKASPYDTRATVKRIEGGTAWVHIPGGVDETPVQLTIDAKEGDSVQVRVSGGKAWLTGNGTAPPTDDAEAYKARDAAKKADIKAGKAGDAAAEADKVAKEAKKIAGDTEQHFWFTETGSDTGAHITEIPQEEWEDPNSVNYHSGGNLLARSNGIAIREGTSELATLTADGQTFNNERGYEVLTTGRLERSTYPNKVNYTEYNGESPFSYVLPWECSTFMGFDCYDASYNPVTVSAAYTLRDSVLTFDATACSELQANNVKYIKVTYTAAGRFPYFTFGSEGIGDVGRYSLREGENCIASGNTSHAEGETTMASGANSHSEGYKTQAMDFAAHAEGRETGATEPYSHAEGYEANAMAYGAHAEGRGTVALSSYQHVEGKYNAWDEDGRFAHIIGNGTDENHLSNAFAVDWLGDVFMYLAQNTSLANAISSLNWGSSVIDPYLPFPMIDLKAMLTKILQRLNNIGKVYGGATGTKTVNITSASTDTYVEGGTTGDLEPGTYIVTMHVSFQNNSTEAIRRIQLYNKTASSVILTCSDWDRYWTSHSYSWPAQVTETTNLAVRVSAGVTMNDVTTNIRATRIS